MNLAREVKTYPPRGESRKHSLRATDAILTEKPLSEKKGTQNLSLGVKIIKLWIIYFVE